MEDADIIEVLKHLQGMYAPDLHVYLLMPHQWEDVSSRVLGIIKQAGVPVTLRFPNNTNELMNTIKFMLEEKPPTNITIVVTDLKLPAPISNKCICIKLEDKCIST